MNHIHESNSTNLSNYNPRAPGTPVVFLAMLFGSMGVLLFIILIMYVILSKYLVLSSMLRNKAT